MRIVLDAYSGFKDDVITIWQEEIRKYNFEVVENDPESDILLMNDTTSINLFLEVDSRVSYVIENLKSHVVYDITSLLMFNNLTFEHLLVAGDSDYPLSQKEWFELLKDDDYGSICKIDLKVIKDEILTNWKQLVEGDFSFEPEYLKWLEWRRKPENKRKSITELSYNSYKKMQLNKGSFPKEK